MGDTILKGVSAALLVTVITLVAGLVLSSMEWSGISTSTLVDIGLVVSCVAAGYVSGKESGNWLFGGIASLGYVALSLLLMALFLELRAWGVIQVLGEGILIGVLAGVFGSNSGGSRGRVSGRPFPATSFWGESYRREPYGDFYSSYSQKRDNYMEDTDCINETYYSGEKDHHEDAWAELLASDTSEIYEDYERKEEVERTRKKGAFAFWSKGQERRIEKEEDEFEDKLWEGWLEKEQQKERPTKSKAWWEEDAL